MVTLTKTYSTEMTPFATDDYLIIEAEKIVTNPHKFFIAAITFNGARFFSEDFMDEDSADYIRTYRSLLRYFGGGMLTLWEHDFTDNYIVMRETII